MKDDHKASQHQLAELEHPSIKESASEQADVHGEYLEDLIAALGIGACRATLGQEGEFIDVNPAFAAMLARSPEELVATRVADVFQDATEWNRLNSLLLKNGTVRTKTTLTRGDGTPFAALVSAVSIKDKQGKTERFCGMVEEILTEQNAGQEAWDREEIAHAMLNVPFSIATLISPNGTILGANKTMAKALGKSQEELVGTRLWDLFPSEMAHRRQVYVETVLKTGAPIRVEDMGFAGWFDSIVYPIKDDQGKVSRVAILSYDITDRKELERQSERRRLYLESVLACAPDAIVTLDPQHRVLEWNAGAERIFGYSKDEAIGEHIDSLVTGENPEIFSEASGYTKDILEGRDVPPTEAVRYRKDGRPVNVIVAGSPIIVNDELIGALGVYTDITAQKQAEKEIQHRTDQLEALRETGLELTAELELETLLNSIVTRAISLLNGTSGGLYLHRSELDALEWALKVGPHPAPIGTTLGKGEGLSGKVWETGEPLIVEDYSQWEGRAPVYGDPPSVAVVTVPVRWGESFLGVLNVVDSHPRTFTAADAQLLSLFATQAAIAIENAHLYQEVRSQANELSMAVAQLTELDRLKNEFIQNVSHELRSPLALIRGYAEVLVDEQLGSLHPNQQKPIEIIARRSRMLSDLVGDIMLILEIDVNPRQPEPVQLDEVIQAAVEDFQLTTQQLQLTLEANIAPNLPPVNGYPTYLRRVVDNLIDNSTKFTPAGGRITVTAQLEGENVILQVVDTGIGIPKDQLERVFERFYQVDGSSKRRYGGVGLGLALVREIVSTYGGEIKVQSEPGKGSTFTISLPSC